MTFHALFNPIESLSNSRALVEFDKEKTIALFIALPFPVSIRDRRDYLKFGRRRDSINGACLIYGKTMARIKRVQRVRLIGNISGPYDSSLSK